MDFQDSFFLKILEPKIQHNLALVSGFIYQILSHCLLPNLVVRRWSALLTNPKHQCDINLSFCWIAMVIFIDEDIINRNHVPACWKTKWDPRHRHNAGTMIQTCELRGFSDGIHSNRHSNTRKCRTLTITSGKTWIRLRLTITSCRSHTSTWAKIIKYTCLTYIFHAETDIDATQ